MDMGTRVAVHPDTAAVKAGLGPTGTVVAVSHRLGRVAVRMDGSDRVFLYTRSLVVPLGVDGAA
ncbi:hypothetical protein SEA_TYPHA_104 [Mycobacterium phage Typha]|uniref:Uncharacterized protein n=1 Tax=Mycobacterium phage Typha TaxID=2517971 RepID=A0A482JC15_9CAUD|nr:hypothetical protein KCH40_gp065 [Mycobacterium phage Typha]QBP29759.1 hypothetical protein SEA_TYPHA_104 [Mycobacterium phage Typha]